MSDTATRLAAIPSNGPFTPPPYRPDTRGVPEVARLFLPKIDAWIAELTQCLLDQAYASFHTGMRDRLAEFNVLRGLIATVAAQRPKNKHLRLVKKPAPGLSNETKE